MRFIIIHIAGFYGCGIAKSLLCIVRLLRVPCRALALPPRAKADAAGRGGDAPGSPASWAPNGRCSPVFRRLGVDLETVGTLGACPVLANSSTGDAVVDIDAVAACAIFPYRIRPIPSLAHQFALSVLLCRRLYMIRGIIPSRRHVMRIVIAGAVVVR